MTTIDILTAIVAFMAFVGSLGEFIKTLKGQRYLIAEKQDLRPKDYPPLAKDILTMLATVLLIYHLLK